ncbi:MAG TPA: hypothetical protein VMV07_21195 [Streptosporangiaceae bacterium]|nr:hypothetical protein [Streptosporangiaceae bacterium]
MRLSWYSDTGVAVFSIWQGGRCTGTFRLPVDDLARMVAMLRRGPDGGHLDRDQPEAPDRLGRAGRAPDDAATGYLAGPAGPVGPASGSYETDFPTDYPPAEPPRPPSRGTGAPDIHPDDPLGMGYQGGTSHPQPGGYPEPGGYREPDDYAERDAYPEPGRRRRHESYPGPGTPYEPADAGRTDPGAVVADPPDYRLGHGPDYRRADTRDYLTRDDGDYPPGGIAAPAVDDPSADRYRSRRGSDSAAHSYPRGWPDDLPDTDGAAYRPAPRGPRGDPR